MLLGFTKMQGLGNDFVVFDGVRQAIALSSAEVRAIADRRFGIGCDQVLVVCPPSDPAHDFRYQIFNADGSEVENCGNGARCFAVFVRDQGLSARATLQVETLGGLIALRCLADGRVTVDMGVPATLAAQVPMVSATPGPQHVIDAGGEAISITALSMGNPHAVQRVADVEAAPVARLGPLIEHHPAFPQRVNAGFMQLVGRDRIDLRVWERGVGETLACGTGACAAVVSGILNGWLDREVVVHTRGGELTIAWDGAGSRVTMTGDARTSFTGQVDTAALIRNLP